jgi:hypothetical protein
VTDERRTEEEIRGEIASEREQLTDALGDLRASIDAKRRPVAVAVGALAAGLATLSVAKILRRL